VPDEEFASHSGGWEEMLRRLGAAARSAPVV
jgi:hypothetical protein